MKLNEYQAVAAETDKIKWETSNGPDVALLGIIGELGSVAGVIKKRERDGEAYSAFESDLIEELGDLLWYLAVTSQRLGIKLRNIRKPKAYTDTVESICKIQTDINKLITYQDISVSLRTGMIENPYPISKLLEEIIKDLICIASNYKITISNIIQLNLKKIPSFFKSDLSLPSHQFDNICEDYEKLPRQFKIKFIEAGKGKSIMQMKGINIGDKITDNSYKEDGYRFHDVFHLANVATLGWSPVFRRMLHRKRKSKPKVDENEDGARAAIVEELVVNLIFNYAEDNKFLKSTNNIDIGVLKQIMKLVKGLEVEKAEAWEWKHCIIEGCRIFREIRDKKTGIVEIDSDMRSITFKQT